MKLFFIYATIILCFISVNAAANSNSPTEATASTESGASPNITQSTSSRLTEPPKNDTNWSLWISIIALIFSVGKILYDIWKNYRDRHYSIEDSFWFRAVIGPLVINHLVTFVEKTCSSIPSPEGKVAAPQRQKIYDEFLQSYVTEHQQVVYRLMLLSFLGKELYQHCADIFDQIEDVLTLHCSYNRTPNDASGLTRPSADRNTTIQEVYGRLVEMLTTIKNFHRSI